MAIPSEVLDGAPPVGTHGTVTIGGTAYVILDEKVTPHWKEVMDTTATGAPYRRRRVKDRYTIELELQLNRAAAVAYGGGYPIPGATFPWQIANEASSTTFVVDDTPENRVAGTAIETAKITATQAIGSITTVA